MMVIGDDINDFNSNFTKNKGITYCENYMEDNNIQKLFGEPAMAIRFSKENDKIIKYYANCGQSVDTLLLEKKQVQKIIKENICWYKSYSLIGGNAMHGGWDSAFKKKYFEQYKTSYMKQAIREYLQKFTSWD